MITNLPEPRSRPGALTLLFALSLGVAGCDAIDPTEVTNPTTTDEDLAKATKPTEALLPGLRAQFARTIGTTVSGTEVISDNYSVHGTGIVVDMDWPHKVTADIMNSTSSGSAHSAYWNSQELRALGDFVLNEIIPTDPSATAAQTAEASYYRGMAYLLLGENFSFMPLEEDGTAQPASVALDRAAVDLQAGSAFGLQANAALARAYRLLGNASGAEAAAVQVLGSDPSFLFAQNYDALSITNNPWNFLVQRALQEMQPLPRLDFLDPKYTDRESAIPVAKAEEMHLILAEIDLAAGNAAAGRGHLVDAINVALSRGSVSFVDNDERRNADLTLRPRDSNILVRADASSPYRGGLVLDRPGDDLSIPAVSSTSLNPDSVAALTAASDIRHAFHLARQEIMILEGRRMSDLGIRMPIMLREIDQNPTINAGDPGTTPVVPAYIPDGFALMDVFDPITPYDGVEPNSPLITTEITIGVDMNRVLTVNNVSPFN